MNSIANGSKNPLAVALLGATLLLCGFGFLSSTPAVAGDPTPEILLYGDLTTDGLRIGSDLYFAVVNGEPSRLYTVVLVDEAYGEVASLVDVKTNVNGSTGRHRLWTRTGVEGCDAGAVHDPARYRFEKFGEAETILDGRTFQVVLLDDATSAFSDAITEVDLPMTVVTSPISAYPSDGAGCLRTQLEQEPLHLTIQHEALSPRVFQVFVVAEQATWLPGDPLSDVRPGGPQMIAVPAGAQPVVALLWASPVTDGDYQIVLRDGGSVTLPPFLDATADFVAETGVSHSGTTYRECGNTVCPPPPPPV